LQLDVSGELKQVAGSPVQFSSGRKFDSEVPLAIPLSHQWELVNRISACGQITYAGLSGLYDAPVMRLKR
jgi:hypothetical protein